jgi:hypothetical protein
MARDVSLQKRHFEYIADTILELKAVLLPAEHQLVAAQFASRLRATNYQFKTERFMDRSLGVPKAVVKRRRKYPTLKEASPALAAALEARKEADDGGYWE